MILEYDPIEEHTFVFVDEGEEDSAQTIDVAGFDQLTIDLRDDGTVVGVDFPCGPGYVTDEMLDAVERMYPAASDAVRYVLTRLFQPSE